MFGGKSKQKQRPPREKRSGDLSAFGLLDANVGGAAGIDNDEDLEAELNMLMGGGPSASKQTKGKRVQRLDGVEINPNIDSMVAECMRDISDDDEDDVEMDDSLLQELDEIAGINHPEPPKVSGGHEEDICAGRSLLETIEERIVMYKNAEAKAKASGESSRARRFGRGLATLKDLQKRVNAGKGVDDSDIPPPIGPSAIASSSEPKEEPIKAPSPPKIAPVLEPEPEKPKRSTEDVPGEALISLEPEKPKVNDEVPEKPMESEGEASKNILVHLKDQRDLFKGQALAAKASGDKDAAILGLKSVKVCDNFKSRVENGESLTVNDLEKALNEIKGLSAPPQVVERSFSRDDPIQMPASEEEIPPVDPATFGAPPAPKTALEALNQRLERYRMDQEKAKDNPSRMRRLGRICKQYEDAVRLCKAGKPFPADELPCPPGFGPIPPPGPATPQTTPNAKASATPSPKPPVQVPQTTPTPPKPKIVTQNQKQLALLEKRHGQFKAAALEAKKKGDLALAKEYLRQMKGFENLIQAARGGLPVDLSTLPVPPQASKDVALGFEIVSKEDCVEIPKDLEDKDRQGMFSKLETDMINQVKMCDSNRSYFKTTGDVQSANKFQQLWEHSKRDLDALRFAFKRGDPVPRFHYEVRAFSRVVSNLDINDDELEFGVDRGISYNVSNPKEIDTYCLLEFPYPSKESPFKDKSALIKDTNNPEYNFKTTIPLNLREKSCQRVFKRYAAKVEVWSRGGFFRTHSLLGTATVKLQPLETECTLHDTFPLMDGRRATGGKVEVKVRLRNPVVSKQVEKVEEKWLVVNFTK